MNPIFYAFAFRVILQTERGMKALKRRYLFSRFEVFPNPIDIPDAVPKIEHRPKTILTVGSFSGSKNQECIIESFSRISKKSGWTLKLIGDGPNRNKLESLATSLGVENSVDFLGQVKDVLPRLQEARVFAFASLREGFPNALAEAAAAGCACISFDCLAGPSEIIAHEESGILVPVGDMASYANKLNQLCHDESRQIDFSLAARENVSRYKSQSILGLMQSGIERWIPHKLSDRSR